METLFNDQTPPADVEMMYIKETVFGVRDGAPLMDRSRTLASQHWPPHTQVPATEICKIVLTFLSQVK